MSAIKLWCWNACPYAQRAWIALLTAGVEFEYNEINPYENRENQKWRTISPEGKVPVIQIGDKVPGINESLVNMEFANDQSNNGLMKGSPEENGRTRLNAIKFDKSITNAWYGFLMGKHGKEQLTEGFKELLTNFDIEKGPFYGGSDQLTYTDIVVIPWMLRMSVLYAHKNYNMANELNESEYAKYKRWCQAVNSQDSVTQTKEALTESNLIHTINFYGKYADKDYQSQSDEKVISMLEGFNC